MASNSVDYRLSRGYRASARLNLQHFLQVKDSGYLLHPSIKVGKDFRIADIGTGTAIWLLDLAGSVPPTTQLHGFDVKDDQYPAAEWLPSNVTLTTLDIFQELPDDLCGQYDLVNVRYFCCVVRQCDPTPILKNVIKMLKPGGYLQWSEQDYEHQSVITANPSISSDYFMAAKNHVESLNKLGKEAFAWIAKLDSYFQDHGMDEIVVARQNEQPQHRDFWQHTYLMVLEEISFSMPDGETLRSLVKECQEHSPKGVTWLRGHLTFVGRKT